ncbi:MAG: hypothetical protein AAF288_13590 [Planctomycetota bacterium]
MRNRTLTGLSLFAAAALSFGMTGCDDKSDIEKAAENASEAAQDGANAAGDAVQQGADAAGNAVQQGADAANQGIQQGADAVNNALGNAPATQPGS